MWSLVARLIPGLGGLLKSTYGLIAVAVVCVSVGGYLGWNLKPGQDDALQAIIEHREAQIQSLTAELKARSDERDKAAQKAFQWRKQCEASKDAPTKEWADTELPAAVLDGLRNLHSSK